jgi:hypothetical protein
MEETSMMKTCGQCGVEKALTPEFYGVQTASADGFRAICRVCFSDNRSAEKMRDVKNLKNHDRIVKAAKKALEKPELLPPNQLHKMNQIVNGDEKKRAKLQAKIQEAHAAEEATRQSNNATLLLVREKFGSIIFLTTEEMRAKLVLARTALGNLVGPDDGPAIQHVQDYIARVEYIVKQRDSQAAEMARDAQETLNETVCRRVIGRVHDQFLPLIRAANTAEAKISLRAKIRARKKALMAMAKTATGIDKSGAERAVVAKAVADALEKLALMLYAGTKDPLPTDTLENLQSRVDSEAANVEFMERAEAERRQYWDDLRASDPGQFEKESKSLVRQIKGDDYWSQMQREAARRLVRQDPVEAARRALLALQPRNVEQPNIIWVLQQGKREIWYWPMGALVKRDGSEVVYDARMKAWFLAPAPAGAQLESPTAKPFQKMEAYQDEFDCDEEGYPKWKYRPEGSGGVHVQQPDGTFKRTDNPSPWTRPERVVFRKAEPPASGAHIHLRHGKWFTQAEVDEAARADAANPPNLLPPLPVHSVADSIALPPPTTAADRAKDAKPLETVWQRNDRLRREQAAREAALLKGEQIAL